MASKVQVLLLLVSVNVLFSTLVSAGHSCNNCGGSDYNNGGDGGNGGNGGSGGGSNGGNGGGGGGSVTCPINVLRLVVCANLLGSVGPVIGTPPTLPCCSLIAGLVDLEAAVCLCTALRANILGINLNIPLSLSLILNSCGRNPPRGFVCGPNFFVDP